ncbi:MAG: DUF1232 domain-containing protein [Bacteroidales bacterium]|nr:DUF1232 domain-containing protein [Bacteroidales bacterium]
MEEFYEKAKSWLGENFGGLFDKIKDYAKTAGRIATKPCLELYFILKDPSTATNDKVLIIIALVYVVVPNDLIPFSRWGLLGWIDDVVSITLVSKKMKKYITPSIECEVEQLLDKWFPNDESDGYTVI